MTANEYAAAYSDTARRIIPLARGLPEDAYARAVPACPRWTVGDILAHLAGVAADVVCGRLEGVASDPWTEAQVAPRRGRSPAAILDEWEGLLPSMDGALAAIRRGYQTMLTVDVATHEQDLRGALSRPGGRDSTGFRLARETLIRNLGRQIDNAGLPALRLETEQGEWTAGSGEPGAAVRASAFEVTRALAGRRSVRQIEGFSWEGDPAPYIRVFSVFPPPDVDLVE
jgi:uncharacterized protein (TIGR03083 family)